MASIKHDNAKGILRSFTEEKAASSGNTYFKVDIEIKAGLDEFGDPFGSDSIFRFAALGAKWKAEMFKKLIDKRVEFTFFLDSQPYTRKNPPNQGEIDFMLNIKLFFIKEFFKKEAPEEQKQQQTKPVENKESSNKGESFTQQSEDDDLPF